MKPSVSLHPPTMSLASGLRLSSSILGYRLAVHSASFQHHPPAPGPASAQLKPGSLTNPKRRTPARGKMGTGACWLRTQARIAKELSALSSIRRPLKPTWPTLCLSCSAAPCPMFVMV
ncbi:DNA gyrase subunit A [Pyrus ussuriensis x Pyrus communis]|uniref:DNA gyrase subunit A n=1 Tax=Pyrus ussuriensis x Pyrus communis TaxID=2448454 RepID=A0A5N5HHB7_9ROSA|nr:DNA gyrase subunit A [Pyrus ussuriensis x Pyrus communis]